MSETTPEALFAKGDRVLYVGTGWPNGTHRVARKPAYKKPRGKSAGWWYRISLDPMPERLQSAWAEVHESTLRHA